MRQGLVEIAGTIFKDTRNVNRLFLTPITNAEVLVFVSPPYELLRSFSKSVCLALKCPQSHSSDPQKMLARIRAC